MIATKTDIMGLVEHVGQMREAFQAAREASDVAREALKAADTAAQQAYLDFEVAQNALVVAAGGTDRSFMLGLIPTSMFGLQSPSSDRTAAKAATNAETSRA